MCSDTSRGPSTCCAFPGCAKSVWQDTDGSYSSYCGRTHRDAVVKTSQHAQGGMCRNCNARPVYVANGRAHDYCGVRCANEARSGGNQLAQERRNSSPTAAAQCALQGCRQPAFVDRDGNPGQFCSQSHRRQAVANGRAEACLLCMDMPKAVVNGKQSDFCSQRCKDDAINAAPIVFNVPAHYNDFHNVSEQFRNKWEHNQKAVPTVLKIWKIYGTQTLNDKFSRYRLGVERNRSVSEGNTCRRFHGTARKCQLGDNDSNRDLCNDGSCSLCSIIATSFEVAQAGSHINFGRFGRGIYTSATSSKADDYVREEGGSHHKAMLLNQVVMGKVIKLYQENQSLSQPPAGYDSVVGEPGHQLNYDEAIVYTNDAIRPLFLVIYSNEP